MQRRGRKCIFFNKFYILKKLNLQYNIFRITVGLKIIYGAFHNFHIALLIWTFMFLLSQMAYIGLKTYAAVLHSLNPKCK